MAAKTQNEDLDDLDSYLDDVLDDFTPVRTQKPVTQPVTIEDPAEDTGFEEEFARQLATNMEEFFRGANQEIEEGTPEHAELQATMGQFMSAFAASEAGAPGVGLGAGGSASNPSSAALYSASANGAPVSFQDKVSSTMNRLRDSSEKAEQLAAERRGGEGYADDESMEKLMKELEGLMESGEIDQMLAPMMEQMMSKELLHEPMKDLAAKYPQWLSDNASKTPADDLEKYKRQYEIITEIVTVYDACPTNETNEADSKKVMDLMQKMQDCGNPPEDILKDLAPGMNIGPDGIPKLPNGIGGQDCVVM